MGIPAADALVSLAARIMARMLDGDAKASDDAREFVRLYKETQLEKLRAVFGAGPSTPGFFGGAPAAAPTVPVTPPTRRRRW